MHQQVQIPSSTTPPNSRTKKSIWQILNHKIWLPKSIYAALPLIYIGLGIYAIVAALFLSHWSWIVPYFLILGFICLHAGLLVATMRWRNRRNRAAKPRRDQAGADNPDRSTVR